MDFDIAFTYLETEMTVSANKVFINVGLFY